MFAATPFPFLHRGCSIEWWAHMPSRSSLQAIHVFCGLKFRYCVLSKKFLICHIRRQNRRQNCEVVLHDNVLQLLFFVQIWIEQDLHLCFRTLTITLFLLEVVLVTSTVVRGSLLFKIEACEVLLEEGMLGGLLVFHQWIEDVTSRLLLFLLIWILITCIPRNHRFLLRDRWASGFPLKFATKHRTANLLISLIIWSTASFRTNITRILIELLLLTQLVSIGAVSITTNAERGVVLTVGHEGTADEPLRWWLRLLLQTVEVVVRSWAKRLHLIGWIVTEALAWCSYLHDVGASCCLF